VSDAVVLVAIAAATLLLLPVRPGWLSHAAMPFGVVGSLGIAAIAISPRLEHPVAQILSLLPISGPVRDGVTRVIAGVVTAMRQFHQPARLCAFVSLTGAIWLVDGVTALLAGASLGLALTWPMVLLLNSALGLGSALPSTPGYVGVYQFVAISVLTPFGVSNSSALAYIVIGEILVIFQRDIPIPSQITMVIVYAVYIVAIGVRSYYWWKSKLQSCVTP